MATLTVVPTSPLKTAAEYQQLEHFTSQTLATRYVIPPLLSRLPVALIASPGQPPTPVPVSALEQANRVGHTESHLPSIDTASLALHYALHSFRVMDTERYAAMPYKDAFNWSELHLPEELEREWYIVAFRSARRKDAPIEATESLYQADRDAHEEAVTAGGLLMYWYGAPNAAGENLATCIWQSRQHAMWANRNPKHAIAARLAAVTYETYALERYILRKEKGETRITVEEWHGGDVGF